VSVSVCHTIPTAADDGTTHHARVERRLVATVEQLVPVDALEEGVPRHLLDVLAAAAEPLARIALQQLYPPASHILLRRSWARAVVAGTGPERRRTWVMRLRALSETVLGNRSFSFKMRSYISFGSRE
jgi:hypothetical protein